MTELTTTLSDLHGAVKDRANPDLDLTIELSF